MDHGNHDLKESSRTSEYSRKNNYIRFKNRMYSRWIRAIPTIAQIQSQIGSDLPTNVSIYAHHLNQLNANPDHTENKYRLTVAKMDPLAYARDPTRSPKFLDHYKSQLKFRDRISPLLSRLDSPTLQCLQINYLMFLDMCSRRKSSKEGLTIPTLGEDLMWHGHLMDHEQYLADSRAVLGRVLIHDIDEPNVDSSRHASAWFREWYYSDIYQRLAKSNQIHVWDDIYAHTCRIRDILGFESSIDTTGMKRASTPTYTGITLKPKSDKVRLQQAGFLPDIINEDTIALTTLLCTMAWVGYDEVNRPPSGSSGSSCGSHASCGGGGGCGGGCGGCSGS